MAAIITKSEVETLLNLDSGDIDSFTYTWAKEEFYIICNFKSSETQKWYRQFMKNSSASIKLPDKDIKSLDTIKYDNTTQSDLDNFDGYTLNPDTGYIRFSAEINKGTFVEIQYTVNDYTHLDIHNYLITLLIYKGLMNFTPNKMAQVKSIRIGRFSKSFGTSAQNQESLLESLAEEIIRIRDIILGDNQGLSFGVMN